MDDGGRTLQHVLDLRDRERCIHWIEGYSLENGEKGLPARAVVRFSTIFSHILSNTAFNINGKQCSALISPRRIQDFTDHFNIRKLKGKNHVNGNKTTQIEQSLDPNEQFNTDESHFVFYFHDGKTLDFQFADTVKYRNIVSGLYCSKISTVVVLALVY
ncbi:LOW QUALITY PROTEIN: hypothetical protein PHMEG_0006061 [Phytophthora megakarya]|uniref:Uncharacterized protein n=1 Tax=Phytophthora megakarya TaxID=4795 RepID=A0A225WPX9_9STRA|nr:LOW QUALITY PROTEIN: hypothetical protein PHMEG_0006061 [Phytophthora megakarya]